MSDKLYGQYCGLAKALDLVGERWTLLIIRELFFGPRRFSDLVEGLQGISTSVLNERLNRLEDERLIIRRTLPPPAASKVYELTEGGQELARAMVPLAAWGVRILAANRRKRTEAFRPAWGFLFLRETFDASSARDVHDVYEFHIDDSVISVIVDDGEMRVIEGQSGRPVDVEIHVDATTFIDVGVGRLRGRDAIRKGKLRLVGSEAALRRYSSIIRPLALPRPGAQASGTSESGRRRTLRVRIGELAAVEVKTRAADRSRQARSRPKERDSVVTRRDEHGRANGGRS